MKVGFSIKINKKNEKYLDIPKMYDYKKVDELKPSNWLVIHMYPKKDTVDENGNLNGFADALFFESHIYDAEHMEYTIFKNKDGIDFDEDVRPSRIYTYKDGSTCIVVQDRNKNNKIKVMGCQALTLWKEN